MILTVIEHESGCPLDRFATWLTEPGEHGPVTLRIVRAWAGDAVPATPEEAGDGLLILGGQSDAYDDAGYPWLPATRALLAASTAAGLPTLGLCLGAQLLAVATGGHVQVSAPPGRESGVIDLRLRPAVADDALLGGLLGAAGRDGAAGLAMPSMHGDAVVDLPAGATWLASSRLYPYQAFRLGSAAWGLQFHPEVSEATFRAWADEHDDVDTEAVVAELRSRADDVEAGGRAIAHRFVAIAAERAVARAAAADAPATELALSR